MGVGSYIKQMALSLTNSGHRCIIATGYAKGYPIQEETNCGRVIRFYKKPQIRSQSVTNRVLELAKKYRVDYIEGADHLGECAPILKQRSRPPVAIKIHSSHALKVLIKSQVHHSWQYATIGLALALRWKQIWAEWQSYVNADLLFAPTKKVMEELAKQGMPGIERCCLLPNPVVIKDNHIAPITDKPTILFVGRLDVGKGIEFLPRIMKRVWQKIPDATLEIAGPDGYARGIGSLKDWLLGKFGLNVTKVKFLGALDSSGLSSAYYRAWIVIVPSKWDNFPGVILEAMAHARAIVASPHGGMPEMLHGTDCVVAKPDTKLFAEACCSLLANRDKGIAAGLSARQKALNEYHPNIIAKDYVRLMKNMDRKRKCQWR